MRKLLTLIASLLYAASFSQVLDADFGSQGVALVTVGNGYEYITALAQQSDAKIVGCGKYQEDGTNKLVIIRYNSDGTVDTLFGNNGMVIPGIILSDEFLEFPCIEIQNDGKILIGATYSNLMIENIELIKLIRLNTDGSLDSGFGSNGIVTINSSLSTFYHGIYDIEVQPDNKILFAGRVETSSARQNFEVIRLNIDGLRDNTFGNQGVVNLNFGSNTTTLSNDIAAAIRVLPDGKIIVAGSSDTGSVQYMHNFALIKLNADGILDTAFGNNGQVITDFGGRDMISSLAITQDNHILVSGRIGTWIVGDLAFDIALAKYDMQGQLDPTFGIGGKVQTHVDSLLEFVFTDDMVIQPDNKILLAGSVSRATNDILLVRYNPDGSLDTTFGNGGVFTSDINSGNDLGCSLLLFPGQGFIVGGGANFQSSSNNCALFKYNDDSLSVADFDSTSFRLCPNPAWGHVNITNSELIDSLIITDISGKIILETLENNSRIDVSGLEQGIYFVYIQAQQKTIIQKFIKE